jgi:EAL domain-containing protein (putative c-di-GMP-specific phosphodiesterase class I)
MPFTELKVDRMFVGGSPERPNPQAIVGSSVQLARQLNLVSVAEAVETGSEWQLLEKTGCDVAQGYLIARPMPAEAVQSWAGDWAGTA